SGNTIFLGVVTECRSKRRYARQDSNRDHENVHQDQTRSLLEYFGEDYGRQHHDADESATHHQQATKPSNNVPHLGFLIPECLIPIIPAACISPVNRDPCASALYCPA